MNKKPSKFFPEVRERAVRLVRDGVSTDDRERLKALEREVKELRRANEILKIARAFFARAELDRRFKF
jgi:transposase-like protein